MTYSLSEPPDCCSEGILSEGERGGQRLVRRLPI